MTNFDPARSGRQANGRKNRLRRERLEQRVTAHDERRSRREHPTAVADDCLHLRTYFDERGEVCKLCGVVVVPIA